MESNEHDAGPLEMKGRKILKEGLWVQLQFGGKVYAAKVTKENYLKATAGQFFEAWHVLMPTAEGKPAYLPSITQTLEPWNVNGAQCTYVNIVHPKVAAAIDEGNQNSLSVIETASAGDLKAVEAATKEQPKAPLKLLL